MEQLVNYVCITAEPDMDDKYKFKLVKYILIAIKSLSPSPSLFRYPHLACEILTADVSDIIENLCTNEKYVPMLWQFLYTEPSLNPLIGRYYFIKDNIID